MKHVIPLGTSEPQDFQLLNNGLALVGTGLTVALSIARRVNGANQAVDTAPTVAWLDQAAGTVRVSSVNVLTEGSYLVRYKLTDGAGKIGFVPNGEKADLWHVIAVASI